MKINFLTIFLKDKFKRAITILLPCAALAGCTSTPQYAYEDRTYTVYEAPPGIRLETRGVAPTTTSEWVAGHWTYQDGHWFWETGHWESRPSTNMHWVDGRWRVAGNNTWVWTPGYWSET
jgi:hypothetical protein